ncbi:MAG: hypothetical protein MUE48_03785 [Desulfobacterales bacterium]|jgi:hypothetical protein|nr:hypothetical protein [Desulfobacterales bacterium]
MKSERTRTDSRRRIILPGVVLAACIVLNLTGCSVFMAAQLPDKKDLNVLKPGVPRSVVIAEMGTPSSYDELEGTRTEVYKFKQGYSTPNKITRAVFHGTADLFTWGLWEVVATPAEYCFSGTDTIVMVSYDAANRIEKVQYVKGGE